MNRSERICCALASAALVASFALGWSHPTGTAEFASGLAIGLSTAVIIYRRHPLTDAD